MKIHLTKQDLVAFGNLSGDNNPMHVNPVYARRTLYGDVIVHGLYGVLAMLCAAFGGSAKTAAFNVLSDEDCRGNGPVYIGPYDLILYFPAPSIFRGSQSFSGDQFFQFLQFYVNSFTLIAETLRDSGKESVLFYPSTVALDEHIPNMLEYSAAKIAGEYTCEYITHNFKQPQIVIERLPRLPTDQTSTISVIPYKF